MVNTSRVHNHRGGVNGTRPGGCDDHSSARLLGPDSFFVYGVETKGKEEVKEVSQKQTKQTKI
jgi:hypothetical protein